MIDRYQLLLIPKVDVGALPLRLPLPDGLNNGNYVMGYSDIDLAVAGLNAEHNNEEVTNLAQYFDEYRFMKSEDWVTLVIKSGDEILFGSITYHKHMYKILNDYQYIYLLKQNAPLTFKWV